MITLSVFAPFAVFYMREPLKLDYLLAGLCLLGAVYFHVPLLVWNSTAVPKHKLMGLAFEKSFRVDGGHATGPGGSHRLPVDVILYIAASENA